ERGAAQISKLIQPSDVYKTAGRNAAAKAQLAHVDEAVRSLQHLCQSTIAGNRQTAMRLKGIVADPGMQGVGILPPMVIGHLNIPAESIHSVNRPIVVRDVQPPAP